jgi:chromate transporter
MQQTTNEKQRKENSADQISYSLKELILYFLKLGTTGFGGPVALVGYMHRDLVEEKKWISEEEYKDGLALAQLAPGPLAAQLGIYLVMFIIKYLEQRLQELHLYFHHL